MSLEQLKSVASSTGECLYQSFGWLVGPKDPNSRFIESITACVAIAIFGMDYIGVEYGDNDPKPKIGIINNKLVVYTGGEFKGALGLVGQGVQAVYRWWDTQTHQDYTTNLILFTIFEFPQQWYQIGSKHAKALARIYRIALIGIVMLTKSYESDRYFVGYLENYIRKIVAFYQNNFPKDSLEDIIPKPLDPEKIKVILNKKPIVSEIDQEKSLKDFENQQIVYSIIQSLWQGENDLEVIAGLLEGVHKNFISKIPVERELFPQDKKAISLKTEGTIKIFQSKLKQTQETSYPIS